ncbi:MAG: polysaccharide pyruvyl transferase CsaB, partial [Defluviitaleaceae bacterium]|nr:polysaccharide pyruvyl transferase CsaB [Defluviitaleaceae bacterium]
ETHVLELCKALKRRGVQVYVASNGGAYERELEEHGIIHFRVPLHNKRVKNMLTSYRRLGKIIKENNIRLVHAHGRIPAFICGLLKKRLRFQFVTTAHLNFKTNFPYNILSDWGEKSLAVSPDIKAYLIENYKMDPADILITVNGIDTDKFSPDTDYSDIISEFGLDAGALRIVSTSRIDRDRSLVAHELIKCAPRLFEHTPRLEIIIVGGGNDLANIRREAEAVNERTGRRLITVTGSRTDINKFLAASDIFVNVSRGVMEAMAASRASIVAGNQGYIGIFDQDKLDICRETNFCCRGCAGTTSELLYRDITALIEAGAEKRAALGAYGRGIIMSEYSLDRMGADALELYGQLKTLARPNDILILGYYGFRNNGDEAVLKAIIESLLARKPGLKICALSMRPKLTAATHGIPAINRYNLPLICRELSRTKLLLTGGGSLIQDVTSTRSLLYYLFIIWLAVRRGAKNMLFANGIGPLRLAQNRARAGRLLNKVDLITVRDARSAEELREIGVTAPPIELTADIAFSLTHSDESAEAKLRELGVSNEYFCVAIRSWKHLDPGFEAQIAEFSDHVSRTQGLPPVFIAMQPVIDEDISRRVIALMETDGCFFGAGYDLDEILGVISGAKFALCMRLHTVIYAAGAGTPVIGLVYDPKVKAMMDYLGQSFYMDADDLNPDRLKAFADEIIRDHDNISAHIKSVSDATGERALRSTELALDLLDRKDF